MFHFCSISYLVFVLLFETGGEDLVKRAELLFFILVVFSAVCCWLCCFCCCLHFARLFLNHTYTKGVLWDKNKYTKKKFEIRAKGWQTSGAYAANKIRKETTTRTMIWIISTFIIFLKKEKLFSRLLCLLYWQCY